MKKDIPDTSCYYVFHHVKEKIRRSDDGTVAYVADEKKLTDEEIAVLTQILEEQKVKYYLTTTKEILISKIWVSNLGDMFMFDMELKKRTNSKDSNWFYESNR